MKLRNKQTGEVDDYIFEVIRNRIDLYRRVGSSDTKNTWHYNSLTELNEDWEDVQKEEIWYLGEEIGNYALPKKDARKITKKILAWKRLKDKGFRFNTWYGGSKNISYEITSLENEAYIPREIGNDLDLLFGGEE